MSCVICSHSARKAIEEHLLTFNYGNEGMSIRDIATKFNVPVQDLQVHALMHFSVLGANGAEGESLVADIKKREANVLSRVADEYWATIQLAGKILRDDMNNKETKGRGISKNLMEVYLGAGNNLRQTITAISEMNAKINGEQDKGISALADVVAAIRGSAARHSTVSEDDNA